MSGLRQRIRCKRFFIWDFDGCFCDTEPLHYQAYAKAFSEAGHTLKEEEYYPSFTHLGGGTEREIQRYDLRCSPQGIMESKKLHYKNILEQQSLFVFPETLSILTAMKELGAKIAIASNSPAEEIKFILQKANLLPFVDLVVGYTPELQKKPAPDIFLRALELLKAPLDQSLIFEDSHRGLEAAAAAGCEAVWLRTVNNEFLNTDHPHLASLTHRELLELLN